MTSGGCGSELREQSRNQHRKIGPETAIVFDVPGAGRGTDTFATVGRPAQDIGNRLFQCWQEHLVAMTKAKGLSITGFHDHAALRRHQLVHRRSVRGDDDGAKTHALHQGLAVALYFARKDVKRMLALQ
jgi:hypothetical protein